MIDRYADPAMGHIWSRQAEIERWCAVETMAMRHNPLAGDAWVHVLGVTPPTPQQVRQEEQTCGHEVVAFLRVWSNAIQHEPARRWLHYGLTSSDLVDTGLGMALVKANVELCDHARRLVSALTRMTRELAGCGPQAGRTHGQVTLMRPLAHPWEVATHTLLRLHRRLVNVTPDLRVGKLSGPAGTHPHPQEHAALQDLGLETRACTQIVPRDGIAAFAAAVADLATFCEGVATQVRLLAQSGIAEVMEGQPGARVGSSCMPHKRNPILSENICGLARLTRASAEPLRMGLVQWGDRDLAHSSVERVALPDLCHLGAAVLCRTIDLIEGLAWDREQIDRNIMAAGRRLCSFDEVMRLQREGADYLTAHAEVAGRSRGEREC